MNNKTLALDSLVKIRRRLRRSGRSVVLTNGCFDLLHAGHIHIFRIAKSFGDVLIVAVNDDDSIRRLKGPGRPMFPLNERLEVLEAVAWIDYLLPFSEDTPQRLVSELLPDVLVKGGDWAPDQVVGRAEVEAAGGRVEIVPILPGHSSSDIINRIKKLKS